MIRRLARKILSRAQTFYKPFSGMLCFGVSDQDAFLQEPNPHSPTVYYSIDDHDVLRILRLLSHIYEDGPVMRRTRH